MWPWSALRPWERGVQATSTGRKAWGFPEAIPGFVGVGGESGVGVAGLLEWPPGGHGGSAGRRLAGRKRRWW